MAVCVALLRGINVSGQKLIKVADLKRMCEGLGLAKVQTYIQSGNVLFESGEAPEALCRRMEAEIRSAFGFDVPVVIRSLADLERILSGSPYPPDADIYVALLGEVPSQEGIDRLMAANLGGDECRVVGREVYLLYHQGAGKSKLTTNLLEQRLGVAATARNWRTMTALVEMAKRMGTS